jgi:hypothetical protein
MTKIYIVALKSDEYSDAAGLQDMLPDEAHLSVLHSTVFAQNRAFTSLEAAQAYRQTFEKNSTPEGYEWSRYNDMSIYSVDFVE